MSKTTQEINYDYFMEADISGFIGEWIAVCENKIIAHGRNLKEVVEHAKKVSQGKKFLLARVPSKEAMIF
ncbi:hypothetical protein J4402_01305 [Candidatus Pacearchaeota archaeon]|nr:hypothetical protein [Candidatus Pacearchaeota archaeon]